MIRRIDIIFEDEDIIVCRKKANLAVETSKIGQKDMVSEIKTYLKEKEGSSYLGVIHRLDQPVEGIIVFAKNQKSAADLSKQVAEHTMTKKYLAVVTKVPLKQKATLVDYLLKDSKTNTSRVVDKDTQGSKKSELSYILLEALCDKALVEINLKTGRHHQIRVQMSNLGCPLWGDVKYNEAFLEKRGITVALCAYKLEFVHPTTNEKMSFEVAPNNRIFAEFETIGKIGRI